MAKRFQKRIIDSAKLKSFFFKQDKKSILFLSITAVVAALCAVFVLYYTQIPETREAESLSKTSIQRQLKEINGLRERAGGLSLTEEETKKQIQELDQLRRLQ